MSKRTSLSLKTFVSITFLLLVATVILAACGSSSGTATASSSSSTSSSSTTTQPSGSNARSGPAAGGASGTVGNVSTSSFTLTTSGGSEGDRRRGVLYDIPERDELDLGECHYKWRKRPRTWDGQHDQRNDHRGHAGHRATDWQRRICGFLGGRGRPLPARCAEHVKAGRSDPGELQSGVGDDRQRNDSE